MKARHFISISTFGYGILYLYLLFLFQFRPYVATKIARKPGQFILQGIFPISSGYDPISKQCFRLNQKNIQLTQAMIYTITKFINNNTQILPGVDIGWTLIDSCTSSNVAMSGVASDLIRSEHDHFPQIQCRLANASTTSQSINANQTPIIGLIGGKLEKVTISTAGFTSSLSISQISYYSFDKGLNNRVFYPYFYRTSISSYSHTQYLFDIFNKFNWKWISFVVTDKDSIDLVQSSKSSAHEKYGICYDQIHQLDGNVTQSMFVNAVAKLKSEPRAQVIVLLGSENTIYRFLSEAQAQNLTGRTFIGSHTWLSSQKIHQINASIIGGAIGVAFDLKSLNGFKKYLSQLDLCNNVENPWFIEIWNQSLSRANFDFKKIKSECKLNRNWQRQFLHPFYGPGFKVVFVMDAVLAFGNALHIALGCNSTFCPPLNNNRLDRQKLNKILQNIHFQGASSHKVRFGPDGNTESIFDMINLQAKQGKSGVKMVKIGYWDIKNGLNINQSAIIWNNNKQHNQIPISRCFEDCLPGSYKYQGHNIKSSVLLCCWTCPTCLGSSISNTTNSKHCTQCPELMMPNVAKDQCIDLPEVQQRYGRPITIIYFVLVTLYLIILVFIWVVMIRNRQTPIVKASNYLLINMLLFFHALSVPASFLYLVKPSVSICYLRTFVLTTFVVGTYTTILCKINQVKMIFDSAAKANKTLTSLTKNRNQFTLIVAMLLIVNGILLCLVLAIPITIVRHRINDHIEFLCNVPNSYSDIYLLVWMTLLGVLCTYFAFKARSLPDNFNESKHIYLSSIIITVISICCFPTAFVLTGNIADSVTGLAAMLLGSSPLLCLFLPKIYIIFFKSELNNRQLILSSITNFTFKKIKGSEQNQPITGIESSPTSTTMIATIDKQPNSNKILPDPKGF